jgi:hypothetical protein
LHFGKINFERREHALVKFQLKGENGIREVNRHATWASFNQVKQWLPTIGDRLRWNWAQEWNC